jgi:pyrimidine operon attenuation protein/uracil phosphoribosyltransferase
MQVHMPKTISFFILYYVEFFFLNLLLIDIFAQIVPKNTRAENKFNMTEIKEAELLLTAEQTHQKVRRMAYQIYEDNFSEKKLVIAGVNGEGYTLAAEITDYLKLITDKEVFLAKITLDKEAKSQPDIQIECNIDTFKNRTVILVDDVLNTGRTLAFSLRPFLSIPLKRIQVAVLVNRDYLLFPVRADYVGYSLSTTLNDHVKVVLKGEEQGVYLF